MPIDEREIGLNIPASSTETEEVSERDTMRRELNFEQDRIGRRGFLTEDIADFPY